MHVCQWKIFGTECIPNHSHLLWLLQFWLTVLYTGITSGWLFRNRSCQEAQVLVEFYRVVWNILNTVAIAKLWVWNIQRTAGTISKGNIQQWCSAATVYKDRLFTSVVGYNRSWTYLGMQTSCSLSEWWLEGNCYFFLTLVCLEHYLLLSF